MQPGALTAEGGGRTLANKPRGFHADNQAGVSGRTFPPLWKSCFSVLPALKPSFIIITFALWFLAERKLCTELTRRAVFGSVRVLCVNARCAPAQSLERKTRISVVTSFFLVGQRRLRIDSLHLFFFFSESSGGGEGL